MNLRLRHALLQSGLVAALAGGLTLTNHAATADQLTPVASVRAAAEPMRIQPGEVIAPLPWQAPVDGYRITGQFGDSGHWSSVHTGLDFAVADGAPIRAITSGVVTEAVYDGAYGNKVVVTDDDGTEFWYCHQAALAVSEGQRVGTGEVIGEVGLTGNTTGPHLHIEIRPGGGDPVDPATSLAAHRVDV